MNSEPFKHKLVKACVFDLEDIVVFEKQVLNDSSEYTSKSNLKRLINSTNSEFLLVKNHKNRICAYGIVTLRHFKIPSGHIYKIAVLPEYRKKGLGTKILLELENFVYKNSIFKIFTEIRQSNRASLGLFQKLGFNSIGILYAYYSCLDDSYELENGIKLCKKID